jgi:hypothetical protein
MKVLQALGFALGGIWTLIAAWSLVRALDLPSHGDTVATFLVLWLLIPATQATLSLGLGVAATAIIDLRASQALAQTPPRLAYRHPLQQSDGAAEDALSALAGAARQSPAADALNRMAGQ